jgi:hypothetical protein
MVVLGAKIPYHLAMTLVLQKIRSIDVVKSEEAVKWTRCNRQKTGEFKLATHGSYS